MQTGNPHEITLLAQFESSDPEETEYRLHKALRYRRIRGEWFTFAPDEIATLLYLIENEFHVYEAMGQVDYACDYEKTLLDSMHPTLVGAAGTLLNARKQ